MALPFPIPSTLIEVGRAIKKSLFTSIVGNLEDHEVRIAGNTAAAAGRAPLSFVVNGNYSVADADIASNLLKQIVNSDITITGVKLYIDQAGSVGTTEINLLSNTSAGPSYTSIFTTKPSVGFGSGDDAISSNAVLNITNVDVDAGDILRLDLISSQTDGDSFSVLIEYTFR